MKLLILGSASLVLLTVAKAALPNIFTFLPLGGSNIAEMGIILGISFVAATLVDLYRDKNG